MTAPVRFVRSLLFVPASRPDMMAKASTSAADAVCLDLEDSVAPGDKAAARTQAVRALHDLDFGHRVRLVRINAVETPFAYRDLVEVIEGAGRKVDLVMVPKAASARDVAFVDMLLTQIEAHAGIGRSIGIEAQIETAAGFLHAGEIAAASPRLEALVFGAGDYAASMRMPSTVIGGLDAYDAAYGSHRWHAPMHAVVAAARAHGLRCMDGPYAAYGDPDGLRRLSGMARALGFDGKQCIHPAQLEIVNAAFSPTDEEVAEARALVETYEAAVAAGQGAASHRGRMIDAANLRMARTLLGSRRKEG